MTEPVSVAFHAVNLMPSEINDSAVVVGCGMIGLFVIQALRIKGCGKIIAIDLDRSRLDMALRLGADFAIRSDEDEIIDKVKNLTSGRGADMALEVVGIAPTVNLAINVVRKGGRIRAWGTPRVCEHGATGDGDVSRAPGCAHPEQAVLPIEGECGPGLGVRVDALALLAPDHPPARGRAQDEQRALPDVAEHVRDRVRGWQVWRLAP
jgi:hypothetical protein